MNATPVDLAVTPSLHPQAIAAIDGFGTDPALDEAHRAFATAYAALGAIANAREAARGNPEWSSEGAQLLAVADYAEKKQTEATVAFDRANATLTSVITSLESALAAPLTGGATHPLAREIREHCRALSPSKRSAFLRDAVGRGDHQAVSAILGAPAYLTGLQPAEVEHFSRAYNEARNPGAAKRLAALQRAHDLVGKRGPLIWDGVVKAIGAPWDKVYSLRAERAKVAKAFV